MGAQWFIGVDGKQVGPLSPEEIVARFRSGEVTSITPVWRAGLAGWVPFQQSELYGMLTVAPLLPFRRPEVEPQALAAPTPEPPFRVPYAGFWVRMAAHLLDTVILLAITLALMSVLNVIIGSIMVAREFPESEIKRISHLAINVFSALANFFYFGVVQGLIGGTVGKRALGLKLVRSDFGPVGVPRAIGRWFGLLLSWLPLCMGIIWVGFDKRKRGWHDLIAGTLVVNKEYEHVGKSGRVADVPTSDIASGQERKSA